MVILSFPLPKGKVENSIMTPKGSKLVDCECDNNGVVRIYAECEDSLVFDEKHKIIVLGTGADVDIANFNMKRIGHVKMPNDWVFHVYECLN